MGLVPEEPGLAEVIAEQRELLSRLRAVVEAKDAENAVLRAELEASRERERRLGLRLAELERRLSMDSTDSGTPSSKERIGAKEARRARQQSERERRKDRKRGGQPGHRGKGLPRDPDPDDRKDAEPPAECRLVRGVLWGSPLRARTCGDSVGTRARRNGGFGMRRADVPWLDCPVPGNHAARPGRLR